MEKKIMESLRKAVGPENVSDDPIELMVHTRDCSPMLEEVPAVVVRPASTQEVSAILKVANEHKIRVMTQAGSSTTYGATVPKKKGLMVIQMGRMNRVLDIDEDAMVVTVEAGCPWSRLERTINPKGWRIGIMPHGTGMIAGIAGNVGTGAGTSTTSAKMGVQIDNVVGLEVVLPTGVVIRTGSWAIEGVKPFDRNTGTPGQITGLFWGSAGMSGVITQVSLRMYSMPEAKDYLLHTFKTLGAIQRMIYRIQKLELAASMFFITREIVATTGWPIPVEPAVWGGVEGCSQVEVDEKAKIWRRIAEEEGGTEASPDIARELGKVIDEDKIRHYTWGDEAYNPGGGRFQVFATIPISRLEEFINRTTGVAESHGFTRLGAAFAVKNLLYAFEVIPYYEREPGQREKSLIAGAEAVEANVAAGMGAWVMNGLLAPAFYNHMHKETFDFLKAIKKAIDPNNIMVAPWE